MRSAWNEFVSKIFKEGRQKNPNYKFKDALIDASKRKSEMGQSTSSSENMMSSKSKMKRTKHKKSNKKGGKKSRTKKNKKH